MTISLSPIDYYFFRKSLYTIQFVFEFQGTLDVDQFSRNVEKTIDVFQAVGSRIKIISDQEIILETGLSVPIRTVSLTEEPETMSIDSVEKFLDHIENREKVPLVKILVTHTITRSFVGFSFSHMLGDGTSFFNFLTALSKICRAEKYLSEPSDQRNLLEVKSVSNIEEKTLFDSTGYVIPRPESPKKFTLQRRKYSHAELNKMKKLYADQGVKLSSNDIIMADLAKNFHCSIPSYDNHFIVRCPVDYRRLFGLPANYFGNAVRDAVTLFKVGEVDQLSLFEVALRIRQSVQSIDRKNIEQSLRCLDRLRKENGIQIFENVGCPGLLVSNLSKFPIFEIDFGLGCPIQFHHASLNPRLALILPCHDGVEVRFKL